MMTNAEDRQEEGWVRIGRRRFLTWLVAAPTLTVAARYGLDLLAPSEAGAQVFSPRGAALIEITTDNRVVLRTEKEEMGQGIATAFAMLVAEEIDARLQDVEPRLAPVGNTSASTSMTGLWGTIRAAAAAARARLVTAAANRWNVDANLLWTQNTRVYGPNGLEATYGELSADAAQVTQPAVSSDPKPYSQHQVIGTPTGRLDARDIVTGKAKYAIDHEVPGALATVVARPPTIGGTVASVDDGAARGMPGVVAVTTIPTGVAVSATSFPEALAARDALAIEWNPGPMDFMSDAEIRDRLAAQLPPSLPLPSEVYLEAEFDFAFVNHAPMEVLNAIADVREDGADLWVASQAPAGAASAVAAATGLPTASVTVHQFAAGGAFGRRLYHDPSVEAAQVSKAIGAPVKLLWTRDDDLRHGRMRPASRHQIRVLHLGDKVLSWDHQAATVQVEWIAPLNDRLRALGIDPGNDGFSQLTWRTMTVSPYNLGVLSTSSVTQVQLAIPTGTWRAVFAGSARSVEEIVIDELAARMGKDPVAFRREILKNDRVRAVLDKVTATETGNWGRYMEPGTAQGVAVQEEFGSCTACLVEIDATNPAAPRITKAVIAVDVGLAVNPRGVEAQIMGATMDGFAAALWAGQHVDEGAVREGRFREFGWPRQRHVPIDWQIYVVDSGGEPGGLGELGVPSGAGAAANAYARATGIKPRSFPIVPGAS